jgi:membrane protein implicated in regulation of membrane protease activity
MDPELALSHAPWIWLAFGLMLCAAETFLPGVFLLWIGLAAISTGALSFLVPMSAATGLIVLAALALVFTWIGRRVYGGLERTGKTPFLNRRAEALIGRQFVLDQAIINGSGRIRVEDSIWRVTGADQPAGTRVIVRGVENGVLLMVEPSQRSDNA